MNDSLRTAEFVASKRGNIFVLAHHGQNFGGKCTLLVPPFAEEMNKSRRIIAFLGNRLAENGRGLVVPDLYGTGDSDGDFADTDCDAWFDDLRATENWARSKGWSIDSAVGIRLGGLLALLYSEYRRAAFCRIVLWQPSLDGKRTLEQFLRLRVAASMTAGNTETVAQLKSRIAGGEIIEVAGYELSPRLAEQMETLNLPDRFEFGAANVTWIEVLRSKESSLPVATTKSLALLNASGVAAELHTIVGEPFWMASEIVRLDAIGESTANILYCAGP